MEGVVTVEIAPGVDVSTLSFDVDVCSPAVVDVAEVEGVVVVEIALDVAVSAIVVVVSKGDVVVASFSVVVDVPERKTNTHEVVVVFHHGFRNRINRNTLQKK